MRPTGFPLRPLLFSSAAVFLLVFGLWLLVQNRTALNAPKWDLAPSAALGAGFVTLQYVLAVLFVRWLVRHPERQRTAAVVTTGLLALALVMNLVHVLSARSSVSSPLIPDNLVTWVQLQNIVRSVPVVIGSCVTIVFFAKRRWLHVVVACLATYGLFILWDIVWLLMPREVQSFGMF